MACPWPATSARTIRKTKPGEADYQVAVNITALCCGWQWLGMDPAHESGDLHDVHYVVPTPDLRRRSIVDRNPFGTRTS
jgi:hypothetical protein